MLLKYYIYQDIEMSMYDACNEEGPMVFTFLNTTDVFSPDYPGAYPNSISCTWKFLALDGFTIQFNFQEGGEIESGYDMLIFKLNYMYIRFYETTFSLQMYFYFQSHDFLGVIEGNETVKTQTGQIIPETIKCSGSDMTIHFESDYQGTGKGFKILVQYVLAGKN